MVDRVRSEVLEEEGRLRRGDGDAHVLAEVRVVVVQLEAVDAFGARRLRVVPGQLDGVGRHRLSLKVRRLLRNCTSPQVRNVISVSRSITYLNRIIRAEKNVEFL